MNARAPRWMARASLLGLVGLELVTACTRYPEPERFLASRSIDAPTEEHFIVCHGYDCTYHTTVTFTAEDWQQVEASFDTPAPDAATERTQIATAIAQFETIVGPRTGTTGDKGGIRLIAAGDPSQLDCIDETTNTTTYLMLLQTHDKLHWHHTGRPAKRGAFIDGRWYHETAVMVEDANNAEFAVDSWFDDNGMPPHIMSLEDWSWSWSHS